MKTLFLIIVLCLTVRLQAQTPICIQVNDQTCDGYWSVGTYMNQAGNVIDGLWFYLDAGSQENETEWEFWLDNSLQFSGTDCGCVNRYFPGFFTDNSHMLMLRVKVERCTTARPCAAVTTASARAYSPKSGNACHEECN